MIQCGTLQHLFPKQLLISLSSWSCRFLVHLVYNFDYYDYKPAMSGEKTTMREAAMVSMST